MVLILNTGNGDVATFQIDNQGGLGILVPATIRASISDRLLVTITDPLGNVTTFTRSEFVAPDGTTGIGAGGGVVKGDGGVELRIPEGALAQGVTLRLEALTAAQLESLYPGQQPSFGNDASGRPLAHVASGIRITSADKPQFAQGSAPRVPHSRLQRSARRPAAASPRGRGLLRGSSRRRARVAGSSTRPWPTPRFRATDPRSGSSRSRRPSAATWTAWEPSLPAPAASRSRAFPSQRHISSGPTTRSCRASRQRGWSRARCCARSGTRRPRRRPTSPSPGPGSPGSKPGGQPLLSGGAFGAVSQADGTFTLWDPLYIGGNVQIAALANGAPDNAACGTNEGRSFQCATAFELAPASYPLGLAARYQRNVASTNVSFPAIEPPLPTPEIQIRLMSEAAGVRKVVTNGLVIQGTTLVVGVSTSDGVTLTSVEVQGRSWGVRRDPRASEPLGMPYILDPAVRARHAGALHRGRHRAAGLRRPGSVDPQLPGHRGRGTGDDNLPNDPPAVLNDQTLPADRSNGITTAVFPRVVFSEPVRRIVSTGRPNVTLEEITTSGTVAVPASLSGVGRDANGTPVAYENIGDDTTTVTSVTIEPRGGLKYGTHYAIVVKGADLGPGRHRRHRPRCERQPRAQGPRHHLSLRVPDLRSRLLEPAGHRARPSSRPASWSSATAPGSCRTTSTPAPCARSTCRIPSSRAR